jgi:hypothetical protein
MYKVEFVKGLWVVLKRVNYPSGEFAFWQQRGKGYIHKAYAEKLLNRLKY